jgi:hypothetical protein
VTYIRIFGKIEARNRIVNLTAETERLQRGKKLYGKKRTTIRCSYQAAVNKTMTNSLKSDEPETLAELVGDSVGDSVGGRVGRSVGVALVGAELVGARVSVRSISSGIIKTRSIP